MNDKFKSKYSKHIAEEIKEMMGATVAQIAVMRKLVIIAHSLFKSGELYDENKHLSY